MANFSFKYGDGHMDFSFPDEDIIKVIEPAHVELSGLSETEIIAEAIKNPLGCGKLEEIIKPTDTVAILVPDMTRKSLSVQQYSTSLLVLADQENMFFPVLLEEIQL